MEVEAQPLLIEDNEKLGSLIYAEPIKMDSRLRSWAVPITTHSFVALLVLIAVVFSPIPDLFAHQELRHTEFRPTLYCMLKRWP